MVQDPAKPFFSNIAVSDLFVPVDMRMGSPRSYRVAKVNIDPDGIYSVKIEQGETRPV